jgi:twitching motility two-component system response regulator PilH
MANSIMIINGSKTILEMFKAILLGEGFTVHLRLFSDYDILAEIHTVNPDLLIIDCSSGKDGKGWELLQQLRLEPTTEHLPIVMCSTEYHLFEEQSDYLAAKRVVVLPKPFDIEELLQSIEQACRLNKIANDQSGDAALAGTGTGA